MGILLKQGVKNERRKRWTLEGFPDISIRISRIMNPISKKHQEEERDR